MIHHDLHGRSDSAEYTLQRCFADSDASGVGLETLTDWFISRLASKDYTGYLPWGCNTSSSPQVFGHTQNITKLRCKLWSHSSLGSKNCGVRSYLHCRQWVWLVCNSRAPCPQPGTVLNAWVSVWSTPALAANSTKIWSVHFMNVFFLQMQIHHAHYDTRKNTLDQSVTCIPEDNHDHLCLGPFSSRSWHANYLIYMQRTIQSIHVCTQYLLANKKHKIM